MIGKKLSPVLEEINETIINFDVNVKNQPHYTDEGFMAACHIFMHVVMDKMWDLQQKENIPIEQRKRMVWKAGRELSKFVHTYTGIDTTKTNEK